MRDIQKHIQSRQPSGLENDGHILTLSIEISVFFQKRVF